MSQLLHAIFKRNGNPERAKFLSRVFGIFSEQVVSLWAADERAPYRNLGRPTLRTAEDSKGHTLDFALKERSTGNIYVSEMKCEIEFQNFRYFILESAGQLDHHKKPAFDAFLKAAHPSAGLIAYVGKKSIMSSGAILIWGAITPQGRADVMKAKGIHDVLSVDAICRNLAEWRPAAYAALIDQRSQWCQELFSGLLARSPAEETSAAPAV
jgi:hypothetical protein